MHTTQPAATITVDGHDHTRHYLASMLNKIMCPLNVTHCKHARRLRSLSQCGVDITTMEDRPVCDRCPSTLHLKPLQLEQSHAPEISALRCHKRGAINMLMCCVLIGRRACPIYYIVVIIIVDNSVQSVLNTRRR